MSFGKIDVICYKTEYLKKFGEENVCVALSLNLRLITHYLILALVLLGNFSFLSDIHTAIVHQ